MRVCKLGRADYLETWAAMRAFSQARQADTPDELWICEHPPVFTLGIAGRAQHVLQAGDIAVVRSDRGGQVTYHGPGQVVAYPLVDLRRLGLHVKEYVFQLERALLKTLEACGATGQRVVGAPGVYVNLADPLGHTALSRERAAENPWCGIGKIAAVGVKVSRHCAYHGVALNVHMDLSPFERIDACGYPGLRTVDLSTIGVAISCDRVAEQLGAHLTSFLSPR